MSGYDYCQASFDTQKETQRIQNRLDSGLSLVQVQILTRHGDRSPIHWFRSPVYNDTAIWNCKIDRLSYENYENRYTTQNRLTSERFMPGRQANLGNCGLGSLTQKGANQHIQNGELFRTMYVDTAKFLSEKWDDKSVYVRSGDEIRLVESAQSILVGLYPPQKDNPIEQRQNIDLIDSSFDNMKPSIIDVCPLGSDIKKGSYETPAWKNFSVYDDNVTEQLCDIFETSVTINMINDQIKARSCHDFDVTFGGLLSQDMIDEVQQLSLYDFIFFPNRTWANRYGIGSFLGEMLGYFDQKVANRNDFKFILFSGHDNSVWPLLNSLNLFDGLWPPLASHVVFEFWTNEQHEFFVEIIYNGRSLTSYLDGCGGVDSCPYTTFKNITRPVALNLDEFWKECSLPSRRKGKVFNNYQFPFFVSSQKPNLRSLSFLW